MAGACLDAQRRVISNAVKYSNDRVQFNVSISTFGAIRSKLAEMATSCYAGESASYRAAKDIEDRVNARVAEGNSHQEAELKGVEEFAIECSILKVAVSEDIQNCQRTPPANARSRKPCLRPVAARVQSLAGSRLQSRPKRGAGQLAHFRATQ